MSVLTLDRRDERHVLTYEPPGGGSVQYTFAADTLLHPAWFSYELRLMADAIERHSRTFDTPRGYA